MAKLEGFRKSEGTHTPAPAYPVKPPFPDHPATVQPRRAVNRDQAPRGYDQDVWNLALLFEQGAHADRIELVTGRPVIYQQILDLVEQWHLREKSFTQVTTGCTRRHLPEGDARHCWLHTKDATDRDVTWWEVVEVIIAEFWSCIQDEHALDWFRQVFAEYGQKTVKHWQSLAIINAINARPKQPRAVMRRKTAGATMPVVSKEGE